MTRNRAVVFYAADASDEDKRMTLLRGIGECVDELIELKSDPAILENTLATASTIVEEYKWNGDTP